jgi:uncharacterized protein YukE
MSARDDVHGLATLVDGLRAEWSETSSLWRDNVHEEFRRQFWDNWETMLLEFVDAAEELSQEIDQAIAQIES